MTMHECTVICRTCTTDPRWPVELISEMVDHAEAGDNHHRQPGHLHEVARRHREAYPGHRLVVRHEPPEALTQRDEARAAETAQRDEQAAQVAAARRARIAERLASPPQSDRRPGQIEIRR